MKKIFTLLGCSVMLLSSYTLTAQTTKSNLIFNKTMLPSPSVNGFESVFSSENLFIPNQDKPSKTNASYKTQALTSYDVDLATAFSLGTNFGTFLWPDSVGRVYVNDTVFNRIGQVNAPGPTFFPTSGFNYLAQIFDPNEPIFDLVYANSSSTIGFDSGNDFIVDSVAYRFGYQRGNPDTTIVDTIFTVIMKDASIFTKSSSTPYAAIYNPIAANNFPSVPNPSDIIKIDTTYLTKSFETPWGPTGMNTIANAIPFPAQTLVASADEQLVMYLLYRPGAPANSGDTAFAFGETVFFDGVRDLNIFWPIITGQGIKSIPLTSRNQANMGTLLKYGSIDGFPEQPINTYLFTSAFGTELISTTWRVAPVGVALTVSGGGTGVDCRTLTFLANDNFNANKWIWDFGDGTPTQTTYTNTVMHTYTSPSSSIPVKCTAEDTTLAKTFVANAVTPILQFCTAAGIEESTLGASVGLYPNPATKSLNININSTDAQDLNVAIVDILGVSVYVNTLNNVINYNKTIDIEHLASGVYFVKVSNDKSAIVKKLIVE